MKEDREGERALAGPLVLARHLSKLLARGPFLVLMERNKYE